MRASLYVFEDNEAVIKMIIKGLSPYMRHVSRTRRLNLDWLYDRIHLVKTSQVKYMNTTQQTVDVLTEGSFAQELDAIDTLVWLDVTSDTFLQPLFWYFRLLAKARPPVEMPIEHVSAMSKPLVDFLHKRERMYQKR